MPARSSRRRASILADVVAIWRDWLKLRMPQIVRSARRIIPYRVALGRYAPFTCAGGSLSRMNRAARAIHLRDSDNQTKKAARSSSLLACLDM
jgi:hypothetical protein